MTTTPTIWKAKFAINPNGTAGQQSDVQTVALANGNFITVWTDDTAGASAGRDIMGQLFDPQGNPIGSAFQLNRAHTSGDESNPEIVALPTGGFVIAYGKADSANNHSIFIERFNNGGNPVASNEIRDTSHPLHTWKITANDEGDYVVAFSQYGGNGGSVDVRAFVFDNVTNAAGAKHLSTAQNGEENDWVEGLDTFSNGDIISVSHEVDDPGGVFTLAIRTAEFRITSASGSPIGPWGQVSGAGENDDATANDVAVLTNDRFVVLYQYSGFGRAPLLVLRVGTRDGASTTTTAEITVSADFRVEDSISRVVALQDGGFLVSWVDGITLRGTRFDNNGQVIGEAGFTIATSLSIESNPLGAIRLTTDGRVLIAFRNSEEELSQVIVDPRDNAIFGTEGDDVLTTQTTTTVLIAGGGNDVVYGQDGNDIIAGETGRDALYGGRGGDSLDGGLDRDTLFGGIGDDTYVLRDVFIDEPVIGRVPPGTAKTYRYDLVTEAAGQGIDGVLIRAAMASDGHVVSSYTLGTNIENGTIDGSAAFTLIGNGLVNSLRGNSAANLLDGGAGNDSLSGRGGDDTYKVDSRGDQVFELAGEGTDTVIASVSFRLAADQSVEILRTADPAGTNALNLFGNNLANTLQGNAGANLLDGGGGNDQLYGGGGRDTFLFSTALGAGNADQILAYSVADDTIRLDQTVFSELSLGALSDTAFKDLAVGRADLDDRILYNSDTGILFYDTNGSAAGGRTRFAVLDNSPVTVTAADFFVVD